MTANTTDRLELEFRPWGNSLWHLMLWMVMTWAAIQSIVQQASGLVVMASWAFSCVLFFGFFRTAQRTRIVLDQKTGHLRVTRKTLLSPGGLLVPLASVDLVEAHILPVRRVPWRWRLVLYHRDESLPNPCSLVAGELSRDEAQTAKTLMARWLIRHGWGGGAVRAENDNGVSPA